MYLKTLLCIVLFVQAISCKPMDLMNTESKEPNMIEKGITASTNLVDNFKKLGEDLKNQISSEKLSDLPGGKQLIDYNNDHQSHQSVLGNLPAGDLAHKDLVDSVAPIINKANDLPSDASKQAMAGVSEQVVRAMPSPKN